MNPVARKRNGISRMAIAVAAAVALLSTSCSSESDTEVPSALTSAESEGEKEKSRTDPIEFSEKPLWSKKPLDEDGSDSLRFSGTSVLGDKVAFVRRDNESAEHLTVAKAKSGKTVWELTDGDTIKGSDGLRADHPEVDPLGGADAEALLVAYVKPTTLADGSSGEENGIAALSLKDGSMLWSVPVVTGPQHGYFMFLAATSDSHVAVDLSDHSGEEDVSKLVMVDYKKREVVWQKEWLEAAAIIDDTVIVDKFKPDGDNLDHVTAMGLKVSSGKTRWELDHDKDPDVLTATNDAAVVDSGGSVLILDPKSGDQRAKLAIAATECYFDGESTLACQSSKDTDSAPASVISIIEVTDSTAKASQVSGTDRDELSGIYKGRIFVERLVDQRNELTVLDTSGKTIAEQLPGSLADITDDYAAFVRIAENFAETDIMSVHKVEI
ncbi:PQQ-binding-like beta-propeller repeat protein [Stackebrandtia nassauensis]|uniref:Pyrrolo-quinoline quinone repeat domain-containing protein n=1 Tax=Stackebrandtia nassauensis (strain DSM 44728 / CIP 108903 / NRRL B-16338 / NBRC 102104 / LLR-40K-21) TaxID=446470 RepID=D3PX66_STANL|nr:PQQ-binding-like beta-propeller repeat protein [Stackebrandtia nassauensis]ADD41329.1 hypothetical protein Snas_1626 [Stackebrandtia nassauensis DSM 44728]